MILQQKSEILKVMGLKRHVISMVLHEWLPLPVWIFRHGVMNGKGIWRNVT